MRWAQAAEFSRKRIPREIGWCFFPAARGKRRMGRRRAEFPPCCRRPLAPLARIRRHTLLRRCRAPQSGARELRGGRSGERAAFTGGFEQLHQARIEGRGRLQRLHLAAGLVEFSVGEFGGDFANLAIEFLL